MSYNPCRIAPAAEQNDDPNVWGCVIFLPSGASKQLATRTGDSEYLNPNHCKDYVVQLVEQLHREGTEADIRDVNWVSVIAAVQKLMIDWNRAKRDRLQRDAQLDIVALQAP